MKRSTESYYRMKLIQEMRAKKKQQRAIDRIVMAAGYSYKQAYYHYRNEWTIGWESVIQTAVKWPDAPTLQPALFTPEMSPFTPGPIDAHPTFGAAAMSYGVTASEATETLCRATAKMNLQYAT